MKCVVKNCTNHTGEGKFVELLCSPCYAFIAGDSAGDWSQAYRNAQYKIDEAVKAEREACAKVCEEVGNRDHDAYVWDAAAAIRARGEVPR
jgi:nuclear transport factor 2 (NTF2) superfamily protein